MKEGLGYLTFSGLTLLAAWFAHKAALPWVAWGCIVWGAGLGLVGARKL